MHRPRNNLYVQTNHNLVKWTDSWNVWGREKKSQFESVLHKLGMWAVDHVRIKQHRRFKCTNKYRAGVGRRTDSKVETTFCTHCPSATCWNKMNCVCTNQIPTKQTKPTAPSDMPTADKQLQYISESHIWIPTIWSLLEEVTSFTRSSRSTCRW